MIAAPRTPESVYALALEEIRLLDQDIEQLQDRLDEKRATRQQWVEIAALRKVAASAVLPIARAAVK